MASATMDIKEHLGIAPGKRRWKKRIVWTVLLLVVAAGSVAILTKQKSAAAAPTISYRTEETRIGDLTVTVTATGQLKPTRTVDVGSEVSGIIDEVLVTYNERVKAGQVLARINREKLEAQVLQDKASLESARARVEDAKVTVAETEAQYKRIQQARERSNNQLPSQHDLDTAKAAYERAKVAVITAEASVTQATATLKIDETNVYKSVIKSPVDGIVLARNVEPGQTIASSFSVTTMFQIAEDLTQMKLEVNIDEADVGEVKARQNVSFTVDAYPGRSFPGRITQVRYQSTTSNNVVTYLAVISVDNPLLRLRPGMTATSLITVQSLKGVLLVPNLALRFVPSASTAPEGSFFGKLFRVRSATRKMAEDEAPSTRNNPRVWVLRDGVPFAVPVVPGATNGKLTQIRSGAIAPGDRLVVEALKAAK